MGRFFYRDDFKQLVNEIGFSMEFYGNLNKASFVAKESPNFVVVLKKKEAKLK